jgi:outer membrane protein TolC
MPQLGATLQGLEGTANNSTASYFTTPVLDIPRIGGTRDQSGSTASWSPYGSSLVAVGVRQEIFDFGRLAAQAAVADASARAAQSRAQAQALDLELTVKESYFAVLAAKALLETAEAANQRSQEETHYASAGVVAGLRSPIVLTRARADLMRLAASVLRARGGLLTARQVLAAVVGFDGASLDAASVPETPTPPPPLERGKSLAFEAEPYLLASTQELLAQQARSREILRELFPNLVLSATLSAREGAAPPSSGTGSTTAAGFLPEVPNWNVGLLLSWPLFDGTVLARRKASQRSEEASAADLAAARLQVSTTVEQAYANLQVAQESIPALQESVRAAQANSDQAQARFKSGLGTAVELADADAVLTDAEIQLALGQFEFQRTRARLARAIAEGAQP